MANQPPRQLPPHHRWVIHLPRKCRHLLATDRNGALDSLESVCGRVRVTGVDEWDDPDPAWVKHCAACVTIAGRCGADTTPLQTVGWLDWGDYRRWHSGHEPDAPLCGPRELDSICRWLADQGLIHPDAGGF